MSQINPTVDELATFITIATTKGWIGSTSGNAMLSTIRRVKPLLEESEASDVSTIAVDSLIRRFANLNRDVGPSSLRSYSSRIKSAIKMFGEYRADPQRWKPRSTGGTPKKNGVEASARDNGKDSEQDLPNRDRPASNGTLDDRLSYPFPLRDGVIVHLSGLPKDLKDADVERIARFLRVLCVD